MSGEFLRIVRAHAARYPLMEPQDYVKLAYQSEFGPEHMVSGPEDALARLELELERLDAPPASLPFEPIGGGLCRWHLEPADRDRAELLARLFTATAARHTGTRAGLEAKLEVLSGLEVPGMEPFLVEYLCSGCPSLHHSDRYRDRYRPHYRVVDLDYARFLPLFAALAPLVDGGQRALVAIDGRCGSGKTGLAALIASVFPCTVFHMDDFFLPPERRTPQRLAQPGGNIDHERLRAQVLEPLLRGGPVLLRTFDCHTGTLAAPVEIAPLPLVLIEGSYAHHPALRDCYDLTVFLTCAPEEQRRRLLAREGPQGLAPFLERWIPLEERYFQALQVEADSDLTIDTTDFWPREPQVPPLDSGEKI